MAYGLKACSCHPLTVSLCKHGKKVPCGDSWVLRASYKLIKKYSDTVSYHCITKEKFLGFWRFRFLPPPKKKY